MNLQQCLVHSHEIEFEGAKFNNTRHIESGNFQQGNSAAGASTTKVSNGTVPTQTIPAVASVRIYVAQHCEICAYSYEVAENIRNEFPQVEVRIIDMENTSETIPDSVFATPTYLLNGRVWSLGNPSPQQVSDTLAQLVN